MSFKLKMIINLSFFLLSQWSTVFLPCEQFLRRLWTMTGSQVKGVSVGGAVSGATNEGISKMFSGFVRFS